MSHDAGPDVAYVNRMLRADSGTTGATKPYAEALLNAAEKSGEVDSVLDELAQLRSLVLARHPDFRNLLASPLVSVSEKDRLLERTLEGRVLPLTLRFLRVLNRNGRLNLVEEVIDETRAMALRRRNERFVLVRSSRPLDASQRQSLESGIARLAAAKPVVHYLVDDRLIGGFSIQMGDRLYDYSVKARLEQMRKRLIDAKSAELRQKLKATADAT
jgi:F-type H+-transporting ATPase subunit delta